MNVNNFYEFLNNCKDGKWWDCAKIQQIYYIIVNKIIMKKKRFDIEENESIIEGVCVSNEGQNIF